jgi:hypothetical protein
MLFSQALFSVYFYAALFPVIIVNVFAFFVELYVDLKFARVFEEKIVEINQVLNTLFLSKKVEEVVENNVENEKRLNDEQQSEKEVNNSEKETK